MSRGSVITLVLSSINFVLILLSSLVGLGWWSFHAEDQCATSLLPWLVTTSSINLGGAAVYLPYIHGNFVYDRPQFAKKYHFLHFFYLAYLLTVFSIGVTFLKGTVPNNAWSFRYPDCSVQLHHYSFGMLLVQGTVFTLGLVLNTINFMCPPPPQRQTTVTKRTGKASTANNHRAQRSQSGKRKQQDEQYHEMKN